jgi:phospholipase/carboxylesterase
MSTTPANLLEAIELETGPNPIHTVLVMHGLGADGSDFVPIVDELRLPPSSRIRFVFPHAPRRPVSINRGMVMRAWYDFNVVDASAGFYEDMVTLQESQRAIEMLIAREGERGVEPENIVLAGFSQGGAMALQTGLRYPKKIAGIMALSCYIPLLQTLTAQAHSSNFSTPIFMAHGRADSVIPIAFAAESKRQLVELGYQLEWHEYAMAHSVCREEIIDIRNWLQRVLA